MDTHGATLSVEHPADPVSGPAVVECLSPSVLLTVLEPTTGLALWHRTGRAASCRAAQAALTLAPFCKVAEGTPDHATGELLQDMPAAMRPLGADMRLLGHLFVSLSRCSRVRIRLEHVVDDACRQHHVDLSDCVCSAPMSAWGRIGSTRQASNAAWLLSMSLSSKDRNSRIPRRDSCIALRRSSTCRNSSAPGSFCVSTNPECSDDH
jgi:hypothetical protein